MMKSLRINGKMYNVTIVEEVVTQERGECWCSHDHLTSSDSVSSTDTLVEETFFSGRSIQGDDVSNHGGVRRKAVAVVEEQDHLQVETKRKLLDEKAHSDKGCQVKTDFPFTNEVKCVQGISEGGAALSAANQVKVACKVIQQSLDNLLDGVQVCNSCSVGPKQGVPQGENRSVYSKKASEEGPNMVSNGITATQPCKSDKVVARSSPPPFNLCVLESGHGIHRGATSPVVSVSGVHPCHAVHECSEGVGSSSGS